MTLISYFTLLILTILPVTKFVVKLVPVILVLPLTQLAVLLSSVHVIAPPSRAGPVELLTV